MKTKTDTKTSGALPLPLPLPLPLNVQGVTIRDARGSKIADMTWMMKTVDHAEARATAIITACNRAPALEAENAALREALRGLFENCAMVHKRWGENSNQKQADAAIESARALLASLEEKQ